MTRSDFLLSVSMLLVSDCTMFTTGETCTTVVLSGFWSVICGVCGGVCGGVGGVTGGVGGGITGLGLNSVPPQYWPPLSQVPAGRSGNPATGYCLPTCGPTVLPAPPLAVPVAVASAVFVPMVVVPFGNCSAPLAPIRPPTRVLGPDETWPLDLEGSTFPKLRPTRPPVMLFAPEPVTVEDELESLMRKRLRPTSPPRKLSEVPLTGPDEVTRTRLPVFAPANPPTTLLAPLLATEPIAVESLIEPSRFPAAKPPSAEFDPPLTLPKACELVMVPSLPPTNPPALPPLPTVTVLTPGRPAKLESIVPPLLAAKPPALLLLVTLPNAKLPVIVPLLFPTNPPASPSWLAEKGAVDVTLPIANDPTIVPILSPTRPPTPNPPPVTLPAAKELVIVLPTPLKPTSPPA